MLFICREEVFAKNIIYLKNDLAEETPLENISKHKRNTYLIYFSAGSRVLGIIILLCTNIITQALFTGSDYWLQIWYGKKFN